MASCQVREMMVGDIPIAPEKNTGTLVDRLLAKGHKTLVGISRHRRLTGSRQLGPASPTSAGTMNGILSPLCAVFVSRDGGPSLWASIVPKSKSPSPQVEENHVMSHFRSDQHPQCPFWNGEMLPARMVILV